MGSMGQGPGLSRALLAFLVDMEGQQAKVAWPCIVCIMEAHMGSLYGIFSISVGSHSLAREGCSPRVRAWNRLL